ncbi:hydroxyisourate hydrolase [Fusarium oxysporum f. sp. raphani 54005]|uniref:5-hydroxyisourate hydrolase n=9 Tax=Fusarium oxysporum species complex TaxID=171631 RepID=W9I937_FUSOX|nr:hydroxyisourate hydrolase [Fusarium oxysporum f. sp. lycopersici 4287]XP_031063372.1 hydroxyisourate hydrolase [Fusarium odoratissimum NRRL 54006]EWY91157.1 hydroxyisourate hydrolase [Fusarium oxysporum NRRL 32931]EWZ37762.1 hydroxyisourate hydrolase [Fusarium oxysporum Fo47]EWZ89581.1 hydroxyisourate hydrolase [Fusarium oxysporum f. sp. lycopersici MN25]EXA45361.1 hydroxyisourate hydrolase [Fusarium oxysporum f. sp. pisi HDV247]EXK39816.1 hydroxyisourate hydrolase [Fusarium oxysporum f. s
MASPTKDPITCHVLDTQAGRPARGIRVRLEGPIPPSTNPHSAAQPRPNTFESMTDDDGRVTAWLPYLSEDVAGEPPLQTLVEVLEDRKGQENTFFPEVTVTFRVEEGQTYHVPLLLSPYSYTSYRGS